MNNENQTTTEVKPEGGIAVFDRGNLFPAFRIQTTILPKMRRMEDLIWLAIVLLLSGLSAALWPRPSDLSDGLMLGVYLIALAVPFTALASVYLVSLAFSAHISALCRPSPRSARYPYLLIFVAMYIVIVVIGETAYLRVIAALLLGISLVLYPAFWSFARRHPITECEQT